MAGLRRTTEEGRRKRKEECASACGGSLPVTKYWWYQSSTSICTFATQHLYVYTLCKPNQVWKSTLDQSNSEESNRVKLFMMCFDYLSE
jgi:hypothetical protein